MMQRCLLALCMLVCSAGVARAGGDRLDQDYPDHRIYVTYTALYRMYWCLQDPAQLKAIAKEHPEAASLLKVFLVEKVKVKMNLSAAVLFLDLGADEAFFKMTDESNGHVSPQQGWQGKIRKIAMLVDTFLQRQTKASSDATMIASGGTTVLDAWSRLTTLGEDPYVSKLQTADIAKEYVRLTKTARGVKELEMLAKSNHPQLKKIDTFLHRFSDTDFDRLHDFDLEANKVNDQLEQQFAPRLPHS